MILNADALHLPLADSSVHCVITSPPYYGLRDYGTGRWVGGDSGCDHATERKNGKATSTITGCQSGNNHQSEPYKNSCTKCGAVRIDQQIGLENSPEEFIANMVAVFREVWRVLRDDGTIWVNLGDSYAGSGKGIMGDGSIVGGEKQRTNFGTTKGNIPHYQVSDGLKPKDLIGIPWRVALALQADGWYLRSDIIWAKTNPMPESARDRPTKAHEYLFLLAKSQRYFFDHEAVREKSQANDESKKRADYGRYDAKTGNTKRDYREGKPDYLQSIGNDYGGASRNLRSVWTIATQPTSFAHFATFPEKLVEPCIKAGTSERGCCPKCGKGWVRKIEKNFIPQDDVSPERVNHHRETDGVPGNEWNGVPRGSNSVLTTGWQPDCDCDAGDPVPAIVFDPFEGSGTVERVAIRLGRRSIGTDLNYEYINQIARIRTSELQIRLV